MLLHMTNNHDINLRNTIRRMEALAGRAAEPQRCRICEAVFNGVSEIQVPFSWYSVLILNQKFDLCLAESAQKHIEFG